MSLFRIQPPIKEDPAIEHPWSKTIKDELYHSIKYAHNSVRNPKYPIKETKVEADDKCPCKCFTVSIIGDRVTEEFIFCVQLIKGLHKYRPKEVAAPIIRGVTTVEWPKVLNDLKIKYGGLAYCLKSPVAVLVNDKFLGGEKELKELIDSKYIHHVHPDYYTEGVSEFARFIRSSRRPCAYMHISIDEQYIGTLIFMLFADILPYTSENFLRLCHEKKGGYGGTPVHRIVKDGWIQCGGFGLKKTNLSCENFIVPHDRRGVLAMANDGRHIDCSTQFFVLLQPAPWMNSKYVAFGQLIDGEQTLKRIENVPTWYESPTASIIITQAGILNMECHDIMINRGAREYIEGHIEDLIVLQEMFYEELLERVFTEINMKALAALAEYAGEGAEEDLLEGMRTTQRFIRKKEDIEKQLERASEAARSENNDFDVSEYHYEPEEYSYKGITAPQSSIAKLEKPYYITLTDVPYPGEVDSTFDLKRFLKGDYCLESDLCPENILVDKSKKKVEFDMELLRGSSSEDVSLLSLNSGDEREVDEYLKSSVDYVSFGGATIKRIAKHGKYDFLENVQTEILTDDELRKLRHASTDYNNPQQFNNMHKKVSISVSTTERNNKKIKRRQTGFVPVQDLEKIHVFHRRSTSEDTILSNDEDTGSRKVRIFTTKSSNPSQISRRPTGYVRPQGSTDITTHRPSVLARLYDDVNIDTDDFGPTFKDYKHDNESNKMHLLTYSPYGHLKSDEDMRGGYNRNSMTVERDSYDHMLNLQHGKKIARKISSDYVKTIDQMEHKVENSIRSVEYAKTRPTISVSEYQMKNKMFKEALKKKMIDGEQSKDTLVSKRTEKGK